MAKTYLAKKDHTHTASEVGAAAASHTHAASDIASGTLSSDRLPTVPIAKGGTGATTAAAALTNLGITATAAELNKLDGVTATATELNYMDGVTSSVQTQLDGKAASSHNHAASAITSGTLAVARGGTGVTSNPSMLVNLGSTTAASVFATSPRPGVTGTLPVGNGGTGATTAANARTNLGAFYNQTSAYTGNCNSLTDGVYLVGASATNGPGSACTVYHKTYDSNFQTQLAMSSDTLAYVRFKASGSWGQWFQLVTDAHTQSITGRKTFTDLMFKTFTQDKSLWGITPLEIGTYIDMHLADSTNDFDVRLAAASDGLHVQRNDDSGGLVHTQINKPTGTYSGNGGAQTVDTGGLGDVILVQLTGSGGGFALITKAGGIGKLNSDNSFVGLADTAAKFIDGVLTLNSDNYAVNRSGYGYNWQVL